MRPLLTHTPPFVVEVYYQPETSVEALQRLTDGAAGPVLFRWDTFVDAYYGADAYEQGDEQAGGRRALPSPLVVVGAAYLERLFRSVVASTKPETVVAYLQLQLLQESARHLSQAYVDAAFELHKILSGASEMPERWKRCVSRTDGALGYATGRLFVDAVFSSCATNQAPSLNITAPHLTQPRSSVQRRRAPQNKPRL